MDRREEFIRSAIACDARFVGRALGPGGATGAVASPFALGFTPYISMFSYEAHRKLSRLDPGTPRPDSSVEVALTASRHTTKMFEDTQRGVQGQIDYLRSSVRAAHTHYFRSRLGRWFGNDLGVCTYSGNQILTTHSATLGLGHDPAALLTAAGAKNNLVLSTATALGSFLGTLGAADGYGQRSFVSRLDSRLISWRDHKEEDYYRDVFPGCPVDLTAALDWIRCTTAFALTFLWGAVEEDSLTTVIKVRFIVAYQAIRSLEFLADEDYGVESTTRWAAVSAALNDPDVQSLVAPRWRSLRNTLVHYDPRNFDLTVAALDEPLFGLVRQCDPRIDWQEFNHLVTTCLTTINAALDNWAAAI